MSAHTQGSSGDILADRRLLYAQALSEGGDHAAAADLIAQTMERIPRWAPGWAALGDSLARAGDTTGAIIAFQRAMTLPGGEELGTSLALAALGAVPPPDNADPHYVRTLFDQYAPRFEAHLSAALSYRAPALLMAAIDRCAPAPGSFGRAWDLGCGTGLMGEALRPRVGWLAGVDLSPAMVERAREKRIYDALHVGEMLAVLADGARCDLVVAADVLVYVGDLRAPFVAVAGALERGGLFAFTVQRAPDEADVIVGHDRRFAHSAAHIRASASEAGLIVSLHEDASTRRDAGRDVPGSVVVLRR